MTTLRTQESSLSEYDIHMSSKNYGESRYTIDLNLPTFKRMFCILGELGWSEFLFLFLSKVPI
jgi:hypothetical protein